MNKNKLINLLKLGVLFFGISVLLFNCEKENDFKQENIIIDNSIPLETVSIDEAKNFLNSAIQKSKSTSKKSNEKAIVIEPDWSTIKQDSLKYSDALLTNVEATFTNPRTNNYKASVLFIKVDKELVSVLYSTFPMNDGKEILHITELNGNYIDSYILEDGLLIKRLFFTKEEKSTTLNAKSQQEMEYPAGCEDIMDIVLSLQNIGFYVDSCSMTTGGSYTIYGSYSTMEFDEITITATSADDRRNYSNQNPTNSNQDCETTNCDEQGTTNGGGGTSTSNNTRTERDKQREMAARIAAQKKKCHDKGMIYVNGECKPDTETPCTKPGFIKNSEGMCLPIPCKGDPVKNPEIAPQLGASGIQGGLHNTCTRTGSGCTGNSSRKAHDGIDLKSPYGTPIHAIYDGTARLATQYDKKTGKIVGAGYHISITSTVNGNTVRLVYFHMQQNGRVSGTVNAGDVIGYQGDSGNLKAGIAQGYTTSHLHIKARQNGQRADPLNFLTTTINPSTGQGTNPCL